MVRHDYKEYVSLHRNEYPSDLIDSLKTTERIPQLFDNLAREIKVTEKNSRIKLDRMKIKSIVYSMTEMFLTLLKRKADEMQMSESEKTRLINDDKKARSISDETAAEYEKELLADKVIISDDRTKSL